jgi:hypothetical protein
LQPLEIPGDIKEARFLLYGEKVFMAIIENLFSPGRQRCSGGDAKRYWPVR